MGGSSSNRTALLAGGALVVALFGASIAAAQEAPLAQPAAEGAQSVGDVDFVDPQTVLRRSSVSLNNNSPERFAPAGSPGQDVQGPRRVEVEFAAGDGNMDVAFAQRASIGAGAGGDIERQGRGSEVRVGRGLVQEREGQRQGPSTYMFVASDNEALTWQPGQRSEFGGSGSSISMQDQVEVGDMSVGVTYENNGVQASLAYVEREESTTVGSQTFNQDQSFAGVTLTMRR